VNRDAVLLHLEGIAAASRYMGDNMPTTASLPLGLTREHTIDRLEWLAWFTDSAIRIPGTSRTIGADGVLSFIPGIGSLMGTGLSLYLVGEALRHKAPLPVLARMGGNVAIDTVIGAIPAVGFLFDFVFKANQRNLNLLRQHLKD
jgi:Domain of unknown function (DUF4112)